MPYAGVAYAAMNAMVNRQATDILLVERFMVRPLYEKEPSCVDMVTGIKRGINQACPN